MKQESRTLLHLINMSGHSQTGYFSPVPMSQIHIQVAGYYKSARSVRAPESLPVRVSGGYTEITLPMLSDYELVALE